MGVPTESVKFSRVGVKQTLTPERVERKAAGYWVCYARVKLDLRLPDGRRVFGERLVAIRCQQEGRKK